MAIPPTALVWSEPMDPSDVIDYVVDCTSLLDEGEFVSSYTVVPYSEATLLGLTIGTGAQAPALISGTKIRVWLSVSASYVDNAAFSGSGATLPIQLTINTSSSPSRRKQRTLVVKVVQR